MICFSTDFQRSDIIIIFLFGICMEPLLKSHTSSHVKAISKRISHEGKSAKMTRRKSPHQEQPDRLPKKPKAEPTTTWFKLLQLPREIRDMIYEYTLCFAGALAPLAPSPDLHSADYTDPNPAISLLRANKQIWEEASLCLLKTNTWRVANLVCRWTWWWDHG